MAAKPCTRRRPRTGAKNSAAGDRHLGAARRAAGRGAVRRDRVRRKRSSPACALPAACVPSPAPPLHHPQRSPPAPSRRFSLHAARLALAMSTRRSPARSTWPANWPAVAQISGSTAGYRRSLGMRCEPGRNPYIVAMREPIKCRKTHRESAQGAGLAPPLRRPQPSPMPAAGNSRCRIGARIGARREGSQGLCPQDGSLRMPWPGLPLPLPRHTRM